MQGRHAAETAVEAERTMAEEAEPKRQRARARSAAHGMRYKPALSSARAVMRRGETKSARTRTATRRRGVRQNRARKGEQVNRAAGGRQVPCSRQVRRGKIRAAARGGAERRQTAIQATITVMRGVISETTPLVYMSDVRHPTAMPREPTGNPKVTSTALQQSGIGISVINNYCIVMWSGPDHVRHAAEFATSRTRLPVRLIAR